MDRRALLAFLLPAFAAAQEGTIRHKPPPGEPEERPSLLMVSVRPQGSNFAFKLEFDRPPWGEECKNRCANVVLLLDTDSDPTTGLQMGQGNPKTGADLAVQIQGMRDYLGESATVYLKAKVRYLDTNAARIEDGDVIAEMDHRKDLDRLVSDGKEVFALVDATNGLLPTGAKCRLVYHPPAEKPLVAKCAGLAAAKGGTGLKVIKGTGKKGPVRSKAKEEPAGG